MEEPLILEGLEDRLNNVNVGDIILLYSPKLDVCGYLTEIHTKWVKISHENPFSESAGNSNAPHRQQFSRGVRDYNLCKFEDYKILEKFEKD